LQKINANPNPTTAPLTAILHQPDIHSAMTEVIGIDHIYIAASDLSRSEIFYDRVLLDTLGFRKKATPI
jgi:hypothetical protein